MRLLLLISFFAISAYGQQQQQYPPIKEEYKSIEQMLNKLESDVAPENKSQAPAATAVTPAPTVAASQPAADYDGVRAYIDEKPNKKYLKQRKITESLQGSRYGSNTRLETETEPGVYHYSYMPTVGDEGYNKEGLYEGKYGRVLGIIFGSFVDHYKATTNRKTWGGDVQLGWQIPLDPFALALIVDAAVRGANTAGRNMYGLGPRVRAAYRVCSWFFPYMEAGLEFSKLEQMDRWVYPYRVFGGGLIFRFGRIDSKSEFSLHKDYDVAKVLLIIGGEILTSPELNSTTPDIGILKFGLGAEFF